MNYTATITANDEVIVNGTSDGKGEPSYEFSFGDGGPIRESLDLAYEEGLYGTGSVGQVRDMVWAMTRVADQFDFEVKVPAATSRKAEQEAKVDLDGLPEGAVF